MDLHINYTHDINWHLHHNHYITKLIILFHRTLPDCWSFVTPPSFNAHGIVADLLFCDALRRSSGNAKLSMCVVGVTGVCPRSWLGCSWIFWICISYETGMKLGLLGRYWLQSQRCKTVALDWLYKNLEIVLNWGTALGNRHCGCKTGIVTRGFPTFG